MSDDKFKLPRSSFDELVKVIRGYGQFDKPVSLNEVSKLISINSTLVSANAGFLVVTGILENGSKKQLTEKGRELALALEHEMPDEMRRAWQSIILECDFLNRLISAVRIRKGMDDATFQAHIAYSAGQPKKPQVMTGAKTVVDILRASELIHESEGKLIADGLNKNERFPDSDSSSDEKNICLPALVNQALKQQATSSEITVHPGATVHVNVQLQIECRPDELLGLGQKIKALIDEISETSI